MASLRNLAACALGLAVVLLMAGCGTVKPEANNWTLPKKEGANVGMIIGRLDYANNTTENPDHNVLNLESVDFWNVDQAVHFGNAGEPHYIMDNNYFVVPNLKPGKYRLNSFYVGGVYHGLQEVASAYTFEVKPGQIKYIGAIDYLHYDQSFMQKIGKTFDYTLRKAQHPTELEMLQWLARVDKGSGWEPAVRKRMQELGH